jgi:hypothetical protein
MNHMAHAKNGSGSREVLIVFYERRSQFMKWNYVRENPVRADLVAHWKQWPYQKGFGDDE